MQEERNAFGAQGDADLVRGRVGDARCVLLVRHAQAGCELEPRSSPDDRRDSDERRCLTPRGRAQAATLGHFISQLLVQQGLILESLLVSPATRARETAHAFSELCSAGPHVIEALYLASATALLETLELHAKDHGCVAIVAHNPGISTLASAWLGVPVSFAAADALLLALPASGPWEALPVRSARLVAHFPA